MIKISKKQALKRWGTLSDNLRDAIFSSYNAEILWRVCENQHLSEDKIDKVATVAGDVLMGFVHPEDFASEIRDALNINMEIANAVAVEIDRKIFSPLKKELENVYQPAVPESDESEEFEEEGKSPVLDLRKKVEELSFKIVEDNESKQENKIDLSKEVKKEEIAVSQAEPIIEKIAPAVKKVEEEEKKAEESKKVESEAILFETPTPAASVETPKEDGPLIIHKEVGFKPLSGKLKSLGGMFNFLRGKDETKREEAPVRAELEIGEEIKIAEDEPAQGEPSPEANAPSERAFGGKEEYKPQIKIEEPVKVVNYSEITPENLPMTEEYLKKMKLEIKSENKITEPEKKIEEKKPEIGKDGESEETVDLGMFK